MNRTTKPATVRCECGCQTETTMNRCEVVQRHWQGEINGMQYRRPGLARWIVLKQHKADFENELGMMHAVDQLTRANIGRSWLRRLAVCPQLFDLQCDIFRRTKGDDGASALAWESVRKMLTPQWRWLINRRLRSSIK